MRHDISVSETSILHYQLSLKENMSLSFIPTVWAARLLSALEKSLIYGQTHVCNRAYEGEVRSFGNTVKIASIGDVSVNNYAKDTDINTPESLSDSDQTLLIDKQK